MKIKRTIAAIAAAVTALTMGAASLTACNTGCEHQYKWTTRTEATCIKEGYKEGVCGLCGYVKGETIPVSDQHQYGEWQITQPTAEKEGKAVKVCALSDGHDLEVTLPVLTEAGTGYDSSEITTPSTSTKLGVRTFVLNHAQGNITFTVPVPRKPIENVADAVELGASNGDLIRSASGRLNTDRTRYDFYDFMYEYGDNYTHIRSQSGTGGANTELEVWASLDENGEIYAIRINADGKPAQEVNAPKYYMDGQPFSIAYAFSQPYYGAENLLAGLYSWGLENQNKDFHEEIKTSNGVTEYTFRYSRYGAMYLSDINVTFTLGAEGAINTMTVITNDYGSSSWELDEKTEVGTITASQPDGIEVIEIETVLKSSAEGQKVPENPYPKNAFQIKSFDLSYGNTEVTDEDFITVNADSTIRFSIKNVQDFSAGANDIDYDPLTFWLRTEEGDKPIASVVAGDESLYVYESGNSINLRSHIAGKLTIAIKTTSGSFTKLLKVDVQMIAPALGQLLTSVYEYGDKAYVWNSDTGEATVYAGQELLFKAEVAPNLQSYVDASINLPTVRNKPAGVENSDISITETETEQVFKFIAQKPGSYTLRLVSKRSASRYCNLIINVLEVPEISTLLAGEYAGSIQYPERSNVKVEFAPESGTAGKATITVGNLGTETLSYVWDEENKQLVTEHASGRDDLGFSLSINEAYKLVLSHETGIGEGDVEAVVVNRQSA